MNRRTFENGSTMLVALMFLGILMAVGGATFLAVQNRYRQVHQNASWQEALLAAESGIDLAVNELRKDLHAPGTAWVGWSDDPTAAGGTAPAMIESGASYYTSKVLLREGEGGQRSYCKVSVDAPSFLRDPTGEQWYRVRSLGVANISGGGVVAGSKTDLRLRKFDLQYDHRTGARVLPQATRLIEAIVKPVGSFRLALLGLSAINLNNHNIVVDSYDSRDPAKSTNGLYDPLKFQQNGNIATNGQLIEAGNAHIYGTAATNGGTVLSSSNVTGDIRDNFYQEIFAVTRPNVVADSGTPSTINGNTTIAARAGSPTQVIVPQINLSGQNVLRFTGAPDGSDTYVQIIVNNSISLSGQAQIIVDPGVHVRMFIGGDADMTGNGITNPNSPLHFQLYGLDRPTNADGSPQNPGQLKIAGNGGFRGTVYAPSYEVAMVGGGSADSIFGSFVGWSVRMTGVQSVHYDEALADGGLISDFKVVSWFEDIK